MAAAIDAHLHANKSHITMSCDAANAFNSVCRTKLWTELRKRFPSLEAFVRVLYSRTSSILFQSDGPPGSGGAAADVADGGGAGNGRLEVVLNNVGTRQGCSMGSFIFALMIHPYLVQLAEEFKGRVLVLAFADDVNLCGEPADVVEAYKRWKQLYTEELQGSLRDDKGIVFAPETSGATAASLSGLGLPCGTQDDGSVGVKVVHDGLRVLGAPVGTLTFKQDFVRARVEDILEALDTASHMSEVQKQHLLVTQSLLSRVTFLLRTIPGGERSYFQDIMVRYDAAVLDAPRRHARLLALSPLAMDLACLSQGNGGLGYRTWAATADAAYLASYTHTAHHFPTLFPLLAPQFPDVLSLPTDEAAFGISPAAGYARRAFARIEAQEVAAGLARACLERDRDKPLRHLQHSLATIVDDANHLRATKAIAASDNPRHPRHMATHHSHYGDPTALSLVPNNPETTFSNADFVTALRRRLLVQLLQQPVERPGDNLSCPTCGANSSQQYGKTSASQVDLFGDHALRCPRGSKLRTRWHDSIKNVYAMLATMAGLNRTLEPEQMMLFSNDRPDLAVRNKNCHYNVITDVRTAVPSLAGICPGAAATPGHAALLSEVEKDAKWMRQAAAQGLAFFALVSEDGGYLGDGAVRFVNFLATHAGSSMGERRAFVSFALQRLRCATVKGACALINERSPSGSGPSRSCRGLLPLPEPKGRPAATRTRIVPGNHLGAPSPWHATTFPTPPPFPQRAAVPWDPALPRVADDPGLSASPTAGVHVPHVPPPPHGQAAVTPAFDPPRTSESPGPHASPTAGRVLPNIAFSPTRPPPPFIVQPRGGALA